MYCVHQVSLSHGQSAISSSGMFSRDKIMGSMDLWYDVLNAHNSLNGYDIRYAKTILPYRLNGQRLLEYAPQSYSYFQERLKDNGAFYYALKTSFLFPPQGQTTKQLIKIVAKGILRFHKVFLYFNGLKSRQANNAKLSAK